MKQRIRIGQVLKKIDELYKMRSVTGSLGQDWKERIRFAQIYLLILVGYDFDILMKEFDYALITQSGEICAFNKTGELIEEAH